MAELIITVPDGKKCTGCEYFSTIRQDIYFDKYDGFNFCDIFGVRLQLDKKHRLCRLLEKEDKKSKQERKTNYEKQSI